MEFHPVDKPDFFEMMMLLKFLGLELGSVNYAIMRGGMWVCSWLSVILRLTGYLAFELCFINSC